MLTAFSHYNLKGFPDTENEALSLDSPGLALSLDLLRRSMSDLACGDRLALPEGNDFTDILTPGAGFLSLGHVFTLENPDKKGNRAQAGSLNGSPGQIQEERYQLAAAGSGAGMVNFAPAQAGSGAGTGSFDPAQAGRRRRAEADDFKYLCRLYGARFSAVEAFQIRNTMTFLPFAGPGGNILSYLMTEILMTRRYEPAVTSFFELVRNRGGNNYTLYWEELPDIFSESRAGEAKGCTVFCEALSVRGIVSDDRRAASELPLVLPTVERVSALVGRQYR